MKRLLVTVLFVVTVAVMASCDTGSKHFTKMYLANWTDDPFQPGDGDPLDPGCSRAVLDLKHSATADIAVKRNGVTVTTIVAKSLVDKGNVNDLEAGIKLFEPTPGQFNAVCDEPTLVSVTLK